MKQMTRLLAGWKRHTAIKAKAIKSLKWKEEEELEEERAISAGPEDAQKRQRSCKLVKSGDADHCRQGEGGGGSGT